ncbi:MAG: hypothetical protein EOP26_06635 [Rhodococcus sp. (in: high G+C Gram-positive bacteria)]|nr:MAG: hypothetical protein EOP26_06635 [Rhodococcus sp. (in: high G+C Gram-positive bacteria)]
MATVTHIDIARARRSRRVLFIGNNAREQGIPVISVHDSTQIWQATARVRASIARSGGGAHSSPHHQGA